MTFRRLFLYLMTAFVLTTACTSSDDNLQPEPTPGPTPEPTPEPEQTEFTVVLNELCGNKVYNGNKFIELYNAGPDAADISDWTLRKYAADATDVEGEYDICWRALKGMTIAADGYLILEADLTDPTKGFDAGLSAKKELKFELVDAEGKVVDRFVRGEDKTPFEEKALPENKNASFSRVPNATGEFAYALPTPGAANGDATGEIEHTKPAEFEVILNELCGNKVYNGNKFIELYNVGPDAADLKDWTLRKYASDATDVEGEYNICWRGVEGMTIEPKGYLVLEADQTDPTKGFDAGLSAKKELKFELVNAKGGVVDRFVRGEDKSPFEEKELPENKNASFSRVPDAIGEFAYAIPTPGEANGDATGEIEHEAAEPEPTPEQMVVPVVILNVEDGKNIESKDEYLNVEVTIYEGENITLSATGRAKGRGNATWSYEKKPYKIKFDEKQSPCGFAANKDWVLLAEYCDKSLMRSAYMFELARTVGLPYPQNYRHVQLYLNNQYVGLYLLTDQVEKKSNRVDIEDDGFLFENDNYYFMEPVQFQTTHRQYWYTFKHPDAEDGEIVKGDDNYNYISGFMNDFEAALYGDNFKDPENGYRKYIDVECFAKWFLVQELIANLEPNMYYVLPTRGAKLQIAPVWDAEWSMGLAYRPDEVTGWVLPPQQPDRYQAIWSQWKYFGRMFEDDYFVSVVQSEWEKLKPLLPAFQSKMAQVAENIRDEQITNFGKWQILGKYISVGLINFSTWDEEFNYVKQFFADRITWLDSYIYL